MSRLFVYCIALFIFVSNCQRPSDPNAQLSGRPDSKSVKNSSDQNAATSGSSKTSMKTDNFSAVPSASSQNLLGLPPPAIGQKPTNPVVAKPVDKVDVLQQSPLNVTSNTSPTSDSNTPTDSKVQSLTTNRGAQPDSTKQKIPVDSQTNLPSQVMIPPTSGSGLLPPGPPANVDRSPSGPPSSDDRSQPGPPSGNAQSASSTSTTTIPTKSSTQQTQAVEEKKKPADGTKTINLDRDDDNVDNDAQPPAKPGDDPREKGLEDLNDSGLSDGLVDTVVKNEKKVTAGKDKDANRDSTPNKESSIAKSEDISQPRMPYEDEPENSHFLAYLLTIGVLVIAAYVLAHNRHKIMGLLVEGRQSRRQRGGSVGSRGVKYKRLNHDDAENNVQLSSRDGGRVIY